MQPRSPPATARRCAKLVEAARVLNDIFMDQFWSGDRALYAKLQKDTTPLGKARLHYFWLNKGPWSDLDGHAAFIPGVPERKPLGANFYPRRHDARGVRSLGQRRCRAAEREQAEGFFTVIRRDADKKLSLRSLQPGVRRRSRRRRRACCAKPPRSPTTRR